MNNEQIKSMHEQLCAKLYKSYILYQPERDEEVPPKTVQDCIRNKQMDELLRIHFGECITQAARLTADNHLQTNGFTHEQIRQYKESDLYDSLCELIESRDHSRPLETLFKQTRCQVRIELHSNYDCWLPLYESPLRVEESALNGLLATLCLNPAKVKHAAVKKRIPCEGRFPNIPSREGRELVDYDNFIKSLYECPNYGLWTFFGTFDMEALWDNGFNTDAMTIPKGTVCGMYNSWRGGGTTFVIHTLREVSIRELTRRAAPYKDAPYVIVDHREAQNEYASNEVYGQYLSEEVALK